MLQKLIQEDVILRRNTKDLQLEMLGRVVLCHCASEASALCHLERATLSSK